VTRHAWRAAGLAAFLAGAGCTSGAAAQVALPPGQYELTAQTVLPHLEEALRDATTRSTRCLAEPDATTLFPLLKHPAFAGCMLVPARPDEGALRFTLRCANAEAASGSAAFEIDGPLVTGTLELKMGAKNMTLAQRLRGLRKGPCPATGGAAAR
jgi:hypothetical protein